MPKEYVITGWLKIAATIDPATYMFDSMRSLLNMGWSASSLLIGFAVTFGLATVAGREVRRRDLRGAWPRGPDQDPSTGDPAASEGASERGRKVRRATPRWALETTTG